MFTDLDARLASFVERAYQRAPGVRRWLDAAGVAPGDIQSVSDLARIPVLTKDRMVELQAADPPFGGFLATPLAEVERIFLSPGPLFEPHGHETGWKMTGAAILRKAGMLPGDIILNCLGYHLSPGGFLLDGAARQLGATVVPAGVGSAELQVKLLVDLGVTAYMGTPSWLMGLLKKAGEMGVQQTALRLRSAFVTAEPLAPGDRARLVDEYGLTVVNAYATGELGVLAYDLDGNAALRLVAEPIIQLVDGAARPGERDTGASVGPGEAGEVVVTNLNDTYPLIRFGTGDLALNLDPAPGASRQDERMIRLVGRVGDAVKVRGMFVHPNQVRAAMAPLGVSHWQAIVRRPGARDELTLRIVGAGNAEDAAILSAVRDLCRVQVDRMERVDSLGDQAGKITDERVWA